MQETEPCQESAAIRGGAGKGKAAGVPQSVLLAAFGETAWCGGGVGLGWSGETDRAAGQRGV